jgi:FkbM family methyltransferase
MAYLELSLRQRLGWLAHLGKAALNTAPIWLAREFAPLIPYNATVIDVGAHAGLLSRMFARLAPRGTVHAFEPSAYTLSILRAGLAWNGADNIIIEPYGLSDAPAKLTLATPLKRGDAEVGYGLAHLGTDDDPRAMRREEIEVRRLDDISADWDRLDFVKADIEGWEGRMIEGGARTIERFRPIFYMELNTGYLKRAGDSPDAIAQRLLGLGYRLRKQTGRTFTDAASFEGDGDYLFLPRRNFP